MTSRPPSASTVHHTHLRVAITAAWLLTKYWWLARRGASPATLATRLTVRSVRVVPAWLPSPRVLAIVSRVAGVHPLRPECLPQALTACQLLLGAGRAASVRLGVDRKAGQLRAHAWVHAADLPEDHGRDAFVPIGDIQPPNAWR